MSNIKYTSDGRKVAVIGKLNAELVCELECPVKGSWRQPLRDTSAFMEGDWGIDPRGRLVEL
ncbi:hypothetical protein [Pseudomonas putida]|uniref:hypothetical protein n=1 Tax=Pseudomonas putida TaxID=303 RepID=UPI000CD3CA42|nr:hypothetical protein [Pseudomonas putida]POF93196.1 hypothetical protein BGP83_11030 [Pseudomonas putida]